MTETTKAQLQRLVDALEQATTPITEPLERPFRPGDAVVLRGDRGPYTAGIDKDGVPYVDLEGGGGRLSSSAFEVEHVARRVVGWPAVGDSAVREWLGDEAVVSAVPARRSQTSWKAPPPMNVAYYDEDGLSQHFRQADRFSLADPEAAGWALWAARKLLDGEEPAAVYEAARAHARWADENGGDWPCRAYVYRVLAKVGFDLAPEGHHGVAEV